MDENNLIDDDSTKTADNPANNTINTPEVKDVIKTHLVIASHGIFGTPTTANLLSTLLTGKHPDILFHSLQSNWGYFFSIGSTTDGIIPGGDRILKEISEIRDRNPQLKKISFIGISLGGIYLRYVIGKMHELDFLGLDPYAYISFASPHVGIADYPNYIQQLVITALGRTTANQLLLRDNMMLDLSDPDGIYMEGLKRFVKRTAYSNYLYDSKVSYVSGAILPLEFDHYKYSEIISNWQKTSGSHILTEDGLLFDMHDTDKSQCFNISDKARIFLEPMLDTKKYPHILLVEYYEHWLNLINTFPAIKKHIECKCSMEQILDEGDYYNNENNIDIDHIVQEEHHIIDVQTDDIFMIEEITEDNLKNITKQNGTSDIIDHIMNTENRPNTIITEESMMNGLFKSVINNIPNMPSMPTISMPSMPSISMPSMPSMPSIMSIPSITTQAVTSIPGIVSSAVMYPYEIVSPITENIMNKIWLSKEKKHIEMQTFGSPNSVIIEPDILYEKQLQIVKNMRQISWTHITVLFKENFSSYTAHNSINASGPWFFLGTDVVQHCVDTFDKKIK